MGLLLISFCLNFVLLLALVNSFCKLHYSRIFPEGFTYQIDDKKTKNDNVILLILGDSRAEMWDAAPFEQDYEVVNVGHGGQTSRQVLLQVRNQATPKNGWVVAQLGINDIHPLGGLRELTPVVVENCKKNIQSITEHLLSEGNIVILTTLFPPSRIPLTRRMFWPENAHEIIDDINSFIKNLGNKEHVYVVDSYSLLVSSDGEFVDNAFSDNDFFLHINSTGYSLLNKEIRKVIANSGINSGFSDK